jgi:hypothetical protein
VFAVAVGLFTYQQISVPILADKASTTTTNPVDVPLTGYTGTESIKEKCTVGQLVAINNYPGSEVIDLLTATPTPTVAGGQAAIAPATPTDTSTTTTDKHNIWYEKMKDNKWQCSHICVKGFRTDLDFNSQENQDIVKNALQSVKIGGQPINILSSAKEILDLITTNPEKMKYSVYLPNIKPACQGPNSVDYTNIESAKELTRNSTMYEEYKAQAGIQDAFHPPTSGPPKGESTYKPSVTSKPKKIATVKPAATKTKTKVSTNTGNNSETPAVDNTSLFGINRNVTIKPNSILGRALNGTAGVGRAIKRKLSPTLTKISNTAGSISGYIGRNIQQAFGSASSIFGG